MKKVFKKSVAILATLSVLLVFNHYMSYSMRIGDTNFYLVETMATSDDGKTLQGLYYKDVNGSYKGVAMNGFPKNVLWNDKYIISKNYDGNTSAITNYVVIRLCNTSGSSDVISEQYVFVTKTEYNCFLKKSGISEFNMKQIDNRVLWWELIFK